MKLSTAIMTHPARLEQARELAAAHPDLQPQVVIDPAPDATPSSLRTARLAWSRVADDATHHLVLQDDAALVPDALNRITEFVDAEPDTGLALFTEWGSYSSYAVRLCALTGRTTAPVIDQYTPCVALVLPAQVARDFAGHRDSETDKDDVALHSFLAASRVPVNVAAPNLADHVGEDSLVGNDVMGERRSVWLGTASEAKPAAELHRVPLLRWREGRPACAYRTGDGWRLAPLVRFLTEEGIDMTMVSTAARRAVDPVAGGRQSGLVGYLLMAIWLTAFGIGVEARRLGAADRWPEEPITTMVDGVMRGHIRPSDLATIRTGCREVALGAVELGLNA